MQILSTGQEASCAAVLALAPDDVVVTNHRSHAHLLARGADPKALMAEIMGKATGVNHGRSGTPAHGRARGERAHDLHRGRSRTAPGRRRGLRPAVHGEHEHHGGLFRRRRRRRGLGARGHEPGRGLEAAPALRVREQLLGRSPVLRGPLRGGPRGPAGRVLRHARRTGGRQRRRRRAGRGTRGLADHCRSGRGPALLELATYRMRGHGEHDHQHYVDPAELEQWAARDPIALFAARLADQGLVTEQQAQDMADAARRTVAEALAFADASPYPPAEAILEHVWAPTGKEA